ncbi:MAG: hypothetical protein ACI4XJ_01330 [Eubacteriales bacterium]
MRNLKGIVIILICIFVLISCDSPGVYKLDDYLPPLMDITTQYPYITSIEVTEESSGVTLEFTEGKELDSIRMRFEGIKCIREKDGGDNEILYTVTFHTTDADFTIGISSAEDYIIDGYHYEAMRSGVDLLYFGGLFKDI